MPKIPAKSFKTKVEAVESILTYLGLSEQSGPISECFEKDFQCDSRHFKLPLTHFDPVEPFYSGFIGENSLINSHQRLFLSATDSNSKKELKFVPLGNWSVQTLSIPDPAVSEIFHKKCAALYCLNRTRKVPLAESRGWPIRCSDPYEDSYAIIFADGTFAAERYFYELRGIDWWALSNYTHPYCFDTANLIREEEDISRLWMAKSLALTNYYEWAITIGWGHLQVPSLSLPCDPVGARNAMKLRDIPKGKSRRDALLHWVNEHWRTSSKPDSPEVHIWPYLRGAEHFSFQGLKCSIQPSQYDLKKAAEFQEKSKLVTKVYL